jgi:hypothetical protein
MLNLFFAWDEAYTRAELATFSEHWAQFIALLRTTRKNHANRTGIPVTAPNHATAPFLNLEVEDTPALQTA